jgi:hypothetical protein
VQPTWRLKDWFFLSLVDYSKQKGSWVEEMNNIDTSQESSSGSVDAIDWCISQRSGTEDAALSTLAFFLTTDDDEVVMVAADTLAQYGERANLAEEHLVSVVKDEKRSLAVRDTAAYCLGCVGSHRVEEILRHFTDRKDSLGKCSARAIKQIEKRNVSAKDQ